MIMYILKYQKIIYSFFFNNILNYVETLYTNNKRREKKKNFIKAIHTCHLKQELNKREKPYRDCFLI